MRYFVHPQPIVVKIEAQILRMCGVRVPEVFGEAKEKETSFASFVEDTIGNDPKGATGPKELRAIARVIDAVRRTKPGEVVEVEETDWDLARMLLEAPSGPFLSAIARQVLPFFDAVLDAAKTRPAVQPLEQLAAAAS